MASKEVVFATFKLFMQDGDLNYSFGVPDPKRVYEVLDETEIPGVLRQFFKDIFEATTTNLATLKEALDAINAHYNAPEV